MITRQVVAEKLTAYLQHRIRLEEVVDWAEQVMMDGEFEGKDFDILRDIISRVGLADVKEFGLTWEDCEHYLSQLGYQVRVDVSEVG